uniref:Glutaredoxin domain-containing protein n=1 Tax=Strongyloides papillosus TaxID=174720 RepID=A0A0N5BVK3_STREA
MYFCIAFIFVLGVNGVSIVKVNVKPKIEEQDNFNKNKLKEIPDVGEKNITKAIFDLKNDKENQDIEKTIQNLLFHNKVILFSKTYCIFSKRAKEVLSKYDLKEFEVVEIDTIENGHKYLKALKKFSGIQTVPQLFIGGEFVGDARKIISKDNSGTLKEILQGANVLFDKLKHRS